MEFIELISNISVVSVILFVVGIGLIAVEFIEPGFGVFGIIGIICLIVDIFITAQTIAQGLILTAFFFVIVLIIMVVFLSLMSRGMLPKRLVLHDSETVEQGFSGTADRAHLMGQTGVVTAICRPVGNVDFNGVKLDVVSRGEYIEKGATVEVIEIEGNRIVVKEKA